MSGLLVAAVCQRLSVLAKNPGREGWARPGHREIQSISWDLALLGEVQEGSGEREEVTPEGGEEGRIFYAGEQHCHQARACFDIPHGEELDRSSC